MAGKRDIETELVLWRHAEAEDGLPDSARALTEKGHRQADKVGKWLRKRLPERHRILVSPATRAQQTAAGLELPFETAPDIDVGAAAPAVLAAGGWPEGGRCVVLVGHQPSFGRAAALAVSGRQSEWTIKKGALWWLLYRRRDGEAEVLVRAVIGADLA